MVQRTDAMSRRLLSRPVALWLLVQLTGVVVALVCASAAATT